MQSGLALRSPDFATMGCPQSRTCGAMGAQNIPTTTRPSLGSEKQDELAVTHLSFVSENSSATLMKKLPPLPDQSPRLCERCNAIDFQQILYVARCPDLLYSVKIWHLGEVSYNSRCALCRFFYSIRRHWSYLDTLAPSPEDSFHIRRYIVVHRRSYGTLRLFAVDQMKGRLLSGENDPTTSTKIDHPWWFLPEPSSLELIDHWKCSDPSLEVKALPLVPSSVNYPLLRAWIKECEGHSACGRRHVNAKLNTLRNGPVTRAIDCKTRTIVELLPDDKYLALSYVWGIKPESNRPKNKGIRRLLRTSTKTRVLPTNVAKVVEDALVVVERLGERYLWVDQYCIDQSDAQDKHNQIRNMDNIYERAHATIVAFSGQNSSWPLPGVGGTPRTKQPRFKSPETTLLGFKAGLTSAIVRSSVWNGRGWTFQEALLSRRLLYFTEDQVYFICAEGAWLESLTPSSKFYDFSETHSDNLPLSKAHTIMKSLAPLRRDPESSQNGVDITLSSLFEYIRQYNLRRLSFEADALDAFRGLLSRSSIYTYWGLPVHTPHLNEIYRSSGTTGTYEDYLYQGRNLSGLFPTCLYFELHEGTDVIWKARKGFPSWSWLGWMNPLRFKPINSWVDVHEADATLLGAEDADGSVVPLSYLLSQAKTAGHNPSTVLPELTSYLWMEGVVLPLRFQCDRNGSENKINFCLDHPCFGSNPHSFGFFPRCMLGDGGCRGTMTKAQLAAEGQDISIEFRKEFYPKRFREPWDCLLTSTAYGRIYHFLILDQKEDDGFYKCVGTLRIEDGPLKYELLEQLMARVPHSRKKIRLA